VKTSDSRNESLTALAGRIAHVIQQARSHVRQSVNQAMVASYWEIGQLIVEHEQQGQARAAYGQRQMAELSAQLTVQFGKGFDASNLRNMRRFYLAFPIRDGFTPVFTDTYEKADSGHEECSCRSEGSSVRNSSVVRLSRPAGRASVVPRWLGNWGFGTTC